MQHHQTTLNDSVWLLKMLVFMRIHGYVVCDIFASTVSLAKIETSHASGIARRLN